MIGAGALVRLALRRDRLMLPIWIYALTAIAASGAYALRQLYPTVAGRAQFAASAGRNPALEFLYGQLQGTSVGALTVWRYGAFGAVGAGLMTIFLVVRHTRADEEAGRLELVGAAAVGRSAPLTAALLVAVTASASTALATGGVLILLGLPAVGSAAFALGLGGVGLVFAAVAAVAAQVSGTARGARAIAISVLGVSYLLRAVGDSAGAGGPTWLSWLSPVGWAGQVRAFAGERWWVLLLLAAGAAMTGCLAFALAARRDQGSGLIQPRPGPAAAGTLLRGPAGLAWRLQRGALAGWAIGFLAIGAAAGAAAKGIGGLLGSSAQLRQAFERLGGQAGITNAYLAAVMSLAGLAAAAYATATVLRLRSEEGAQLAEPLLAAPVGRVRWALSHLVLAVAGTAVVLAAAGLGAGIASGLRGGNLTTALPSLLGAALAQLPAALAVAGVAALLFGLLPGWCVPGGWAALAVTALIGLFGPVVRVAGWVLDISPFSQVPRLPGGMVSPVPLLWLAAAAVTLGAAGLAGLRRRDLA
jgi:ABC-2 type transport system permease protein